MVVFDTSLQNIKVQKNRFFKNSKILKLQFGDYGFAVKNESKIELIHITFIKKCLKKLSGKKNKSSKINLRFWKIWMSLLPNSVFSKKSKNSRMGKGKGLFDRWMFKVQKGFVLAEFTGISKYRLHKIIIFLNKKLKTKMNLVSAPLASVNFTNWSNLNNSIEFFNKYRYM